MKNRGAYGRLQGSPDACASPLDARLSGWLAGWLPAEYGPKDACMCPPDACVVHFEAHHLWRDLSDRFRRTLSLFLSDL